jgi:UvrD-like helicase C-terminal domain
VVQGAKQIIQPERKAVTVHKAKGLEFPVVILADPTCPASRDTPSRHVVPSRKLWLEPLCGCSPIELIEAVPAATKRRQCGLRTWRRHGRATCSWRRFVEMGRSAAGWKCSTRAYTLRNRRNGSRIVYLGPRRSGRKASSIADQRARLRPLDRCGLVFTNRVWAITEWLGGIRGYWSSTSRRAEANGRLVNATREEIDTAVTTVNEALKHPLMRRATTALSLRRETPVQHQIKEGPLVEGVLDLAFQEDTPEFKGWTVVDFKTEEIEIAKEQYLAQAASYVEAVRTTNRAGG